MIYLANDKTSISVEPDYLNRLIQQHREITQDRNEWRAATFILFGAFLVVLGAWLI